MLFANYKSIACSIERRLLLSLVECGINSALPKNFMQRSIKFRKGILTAQKRKFDLRGKRIFVIGFGKMSNEMALEIEGIIGPENIEFGIVISNCIRKKPKKIIALEANHPIPSSKSVEAAKKIMSVKEKFRLGKNDFVIALVSGGGSSLMAYPAGDITLAEKKKTIGELIRSGANVHEITIIKKKISSIKGGKLAAHFYPAQILSLVVSDVVGNNFDVIASGPLARDNSSFSDALDIIKKYNLQNKIPTKIIDYIKKCKNESRNKFKHVAQILMASNETILDSIKEAAEKKGITVIKKGGIQGESQLVAKRICQSLNKHKIKCPILFIYGGETTVTISNNTGKGGRNQEFISACLKYLDHGKLKNYRWAAASVASDGVDFISESCGGIIDRMTIRELKRRNIDLDSYLKRHDSYNLLDTINSNLSTNGPTGTNVGDIMLFLYM